MEEGGERLGGYFMSSDLLKFPWAKKGSLDFTSWSNVSYRGVPSYLVADLGMTKQRDVAS